MRRARPLAVLLALAAAMPHLAAAEELGRLFFSPEQRRALDARRQTRTPDKPAAVVISPTMRLDGYVKRSGGKSTVWVNGEAVDSPAPLPDGTEARVAVRAEGGRPVRMKPGETLDRGNGQVRDVIGGGEIRVGRQRP